MGKLSWIYAGHRGSFNQEEGRSESGKRGMTIEAKDGLWRQRKGPFAKGSMCAVGVSEGNKTDSPQESSLAVLPC